MFFRINVNGEEFKVGHISWFNSFGNYYIMKDDRFYHKNRQYCDWMTKENYFGTLIEVIRFLHADQYPKFYHFNGVEIEDNRINAWIDDLLSEVSEENYVLSCASGDTHVFVHYYIGDDIIDVIVCNASGVSSVEVDPKTKLYTPYKRPSK